MIGDFPIGVGLFWESESGLFDGGVQEFARMGVVEEGEVTDDFVVY